MQVHGVIVVQHLTFAGYNDSWVPDGLARTPSRQDDLAWAMSHPDSYMPWLPQSWRPNNAFHVVASVHFLRHIWHPKELLSEVNMILDGAYSAARAKADFIGTIIQDACDIDKFDG